MSRYWLRVQVLGRYVSRYLGTCPGIGPVRVQVFGYVSRYWAGTCAGIGVRVQVFGYVSRYWGAFLCVNVVDDSQESNHAILTAMSKLINTNISNRVWNTRCYYAVAIVFTVNDINRKEMRLSVYITVQRSIDDRCL